jgi:hypothetical protein
LRESKHGHARNRHSAERATPAKLRQIVLAGVLGTAVEWYNFLIYGVGAALVFNKLFFPTFDPLVGTLAAFGSCVGRRDRRKAVIAAKETAFREF